MAAEPFPAQRQHGHRQQKRGVTKSLEEQVGTEGPYRTDQVVSGLALRSARRDVKGSVVRIVGKQGGRNEQANYDEQEANEFVQPLVFRRCQKAHRVHLSDASCAKSRAGTTTLGKAE